ncbi:hypothetical protein ES703_77808 [subsurface metagenome]
MPDSQIHFESAYSSDLPFKLLAKATPCQASLYKSRELQIVCWFEGDEDSPSA